MIRTRLQCDTPFFPNMLNNGKVEVCLKEDVDKEIRRLRRALWLARIERAKDKQTYYNHIRGDGWVHKVNQWIEVERKCLKKVEEYK